MSRERRRMRHLVARGRKLPRVCFYGDLTELQIGIMDLRVSMVKRDSVIEPLNCIENLKYIGT